MINIDKLQIGDIVGTTSMWPHATIIKARTWGIRYAFDQTKCNHIATVVDRGHGLKYFAEMLGKGIALTQIWEYNHSAPRQHVCFVGRHPEMTCETETEGYVRRMMEYNEHILDLHAKHVKYGWDDILSFFPFFAHKKDDPNTLICNELPLEGFRHVGIATPEQWRFKMSPADWQKWNRLKDITKEVIG